MQANTIIFLAAAAIVIIIGAIGEHRLDDENWGKKKRFRQRVNICYQRMIIRHRTPYAEIGWMPARRRIW